MMTMMERQHSYADLANTAHSRLNNDFVLNITTDVNKEQYFKVYMYRRLVQNDEYIHST